MASAVQRPMPSRPAPPARGPPARAPRPVAPAPRPAPAKPSALAPRAPPSAVPQVYRRPPPAPIAQDYGYASLGGPAPVFVQAKPSWTRPGAVTASATLGFVLAGMSVVAAITWFSAADFLSLFGTSAGEYLFRAATNLLVATGLLLGGIAAMSRQSWGRFTLVGAAGLHLVYILMRVAQGARGDIVYLFMDGTAAALMLLPPATLYFRQKAPAGLR